MNGLPNGFHLRLTTNKSDGRKIAGGRAEENRRKYVPTIPHTDTHTELRSPTNNKIIPIALFYQNKNPLQHKMSQGVIWGG